MDKQRLTLSVLTLLPLAVACGTGTGPSSVGAARDGGVTGVHWNVESLTVDGRTTRSPGGAYLRIDRDGRVSGNLGCNGFGATATVRGDRLGLGSLRTTEMACGKTPMAFEAGLARAFGGDTLTTAVEGDDLTLTTHAGDRVALTREADAPLLGTKWTITSVGGGDVAGSLPAGAAAYLVLDGRRGSLSGRLGCNSVSAKATVRDGHITLGAPRTTRMMCDASLMDTERTLLRLFDGTADYVLDHRSLALTSANGTQVTAVAEE
ncbi:MULTISPECIES: META domain-containing protein [unclassified Streptomyces]|uniref:META domain-containing protein n=1 Tax=unclassified Streptomyces TaxID=2593676 RepID=UPI0036A1BF38